MVNWVIRAERRTYRRGFFNTLINPANQTRCLCWPNFFVWLFVLAGFIGSHLVIASITDYEVSHGIVHDLRSLHDFEEVFRTFFKAISPAVVCSLIAGCMMGLFNPDNWKRSPRTSQ